MRSKKISEEEIMGLIGKVLRQKTPEKLKELFDFLLTERELNDIARRNKVLTMLEKGNTYRAIQANLKMSANTVSRLSNKLGYGEVESNRMGKINENRRIITPSSRTKKRRLRYKKAPTIGEILLGS